MGSDRPECLCRPERGNNVGFAAPTQNAGTDRDVGAEVAPLGIEAAKGLLDVREAGAVLDMEEGRSLSRPRHHVRSTCELIVLERLVDPNVEADSPQVLRLSLAHGSVDWVLGAASRRFTPPRIGELELRSQAQRVGETHVGLERSGTAGLDVVDRGQTDAGEVGHILEPQPTAIPFLVDCSPEGLCRSEQFTIDTPSA